MLRKIIFVLILIPLAIVLIALTVANRQSVSLNLDVFNPSNGALSFDAPFSYGFTLLALLVFWLAVLEAGLPKASTARKNVPIKKKSSIYAMK